VILRLGERGRKVIQERRKLVREVNPLSEAGEKGKSEEGEKGDLKKGNHQG